MHDEATPEYQSVIDQMTAGQEYLFENFGIIPQVGWQIDSHGHSAVTPSLFSMLGIDTVISTKIGASEKSVLTKGRQMNFIWEGHQISDEMEKYSVLMHPTPENFNIDFPFGFISKEEFH